MKAIIEVNRRGSVFKAARKQIAQKGRGRTPDFSLTFESARMLFAELTPARLDLLNTLHGMGPATVYALAKTAGRNYSNVHADIARLIELGLIERTDDDAVTVPFDAVEIRMDLARVA
jgi:predicted transcriptional regulator